MPRGAYHGGAIERFDLVAIFDEPLGGDHRPGIFDDGVRGRVPSIVGDGQPLEDTLQRTIHEPIRSELVEQAFRFSENRLEPFVERDHGIGLVETEMFYRAARTRARAVPDFALGLAWP